MMISFWKKLLQTVVSFFDLNAEGRPEKTILTERRAFSLLLLFAALAALAGLNARELDSGDETRVAGIAAEMFVEKDYLIPRLNGEPFLEYPPLYYWAASAAFGAFGINDAAAKLPNALAAIGSAVVLFFLARRMKYSPRCALMAGVMLSSGIQFFLNSRRCMVDMTLAFFILFAVNAFHGMFASRAPGRKALYTLLFAVGLAGGTLTKGLVGMAIPLSAAGMWLVVMDIRNRTFSWSRYCLAGCGVLAAMAGTAVWYVLLRNAEGGEAMFHEAFVVNNLGRFTGSQGDHRESPFFYFLQFPSFFWPWLPFFFFGLYRVWKEFRHKFDPNLLLAALFFLVPFLLMSIASGKRTVYFLPLFAPMALLAARLPIWETVLHPLVRRWAGVAGCLFFAAFAAFSLGWSVVWPLLGLLFFLGWFLRRRAAYAAAAGALAVASLETMPSGWTNPDSSLRPLFEACRELEKEGVKLRLHSPPERTSGAAYYYLRHRLPELSQQTPFPPPPGEAWVLRTRGRKEIPEGKVFADHHLLVETKRQ